MGMDTMKKETEAFKKWLTKRKLAPSTVLTYTSAVNEFLKFAKDKGINQKIITDFLDTRKGVYHTFFALKRYAWYKDITVDWREIKSKLRWRKTKKVRSKELSFEEIRLLAQRLPKPYNQIIVLQFEFGARVREILIMKKENLSLDKPHIKALLKTKGKKSRVVYTVSEEAKRILTPHLNKKGVLFPRDLFLSGGEKKVAERQTRSIYHKVWRTVKAKAKEVLGKDLSTHWFRHARVVYLYNEGYDVRTIQKFTGHSSLDQLQAYLIAAGVDAKRLAKSERKRAKMKW